jgi:aquaporin Z
MHYQKYFAELLGTFLLTLSVVLSLKAGAGTILHTAVIAALVLGACVYTIGAISGCHINPAVTLALYADRKIHGKEAGMYISFQFIGAVLAGIVLAMLFKEQFTSPVALSFDWRIFITEALGAFFFIFGISAVVHKKVDASMSGIVIGSSLLIGIMLAVHAGGAGVLNPAVALGARALNFSTLLGPIVGGVLAVKMYSALTK